MHHVPCVGPDADVHIVLDPHDDVGRVVRKEHGGPRRQHKQDGTGVLRIYRCQRGLSDFRMYRKIRTIVKSQMSFRGNQSQFKDI